MKILQLLPCLSYGDAIGNDVMALDKTIKEMGYETAIYADIITDKMKDKGISVDHMPKLNDDDIIIYHLAVASRINKMLPKMKGRKIIIYHNITPGEFYKEYSKEYYYACDAGIKEAIELKDVADYCLADSEFNKNDLIKMGYTCKIDVLPILIPFSDYEKKPSEKVINKYKDDGYTNFVFTGRVVPNKKQEDVIAAFYAYQKQYNEKSRLFLVGNYAGMDKYLNRLKEYIDYLGVENVIFTGHIPFDEILAYYHLADIFMCMSEHEGFCVPIVEAMCFNKPIIGYDYAAVGETMGEGGFLVKEKNPIEIAAIANRILTDSKLKEEILAKQQSRLAHFSNEGVKKLFEEYIKSFIETK